MWKPKQADHLKKNIILDAWEGIGKIMDTSRKNCKHKMINLLLAFHRQIKNICCLLRKKMIVPCFQNLRGKLALSFQKKRKNNKIF